MADVTISSLPQGTPSGNALLPYSQGGTTYATTVSSLNTGSNQSWQVAGDQISIFSNTNVRADIGVYDLYVKTNPNACGSGDYRDFYYGKIYIGIGFQYPENFVVKYIGWQQISTPPRTFCDSGGGNLTITAFMYNPSNGIEYTKRNIYLGDINDLFIKIRISGYTYNNTNCLPPYAAQNSNTVIRIAKAITG